RRSHQTPRSQCDREISAEPSAGTGARTNASAWTRGRRRDAGVTAHPGRRRVCKLKTRVEIDLSLCHGQAWPFEEGRRFARLCPGHLRLRFEPDCMTWMSATSADERGHPGEAKSFLL